MWQICMFLRKSVRLLVPDATSRIGFNLLFLHLFAYGYMGFMAGLAGIVQSYTVQSVAPDSLLGYELTVLAAVVLGGASLSGGRGTLLGTVMGVMLLAIIQNGLNLMNVSSYWQTIITGIIIILSISATALHFSTFFAKNRRKMTACQKKLII
ncbi:ABC transporter permease [Mannheimia haemolytica]|uniref:ABC transporter permease n=1 Tax=Mannheimia haemolytica TaxID=75985 RepID=UPI003CC8903F